MTTIASASPAPAPDSGPRVRLKSWLKSRLPPEYVAVITELRRLPGADRRRFASLRVRRAIRPRFDLSTLRPDATMVFVCHGNKLRSPMAEALLRKMVADRGLGDVRVLSAGTHAAPERPVSPAARLAASRHGVSLEMHRARILTDALVRDADVVFVMDRGNEADLITRFAHAERKVVMLGAFAPDPSLAAIILDPDNGTVSDLQRCYARLEACVDALAREILRTRPAAR